ncbi:SWIM zinc finger family protein, partial [Thermoflexus sp.]|uniref:SWIM zinc finger family protein n=1 Tax=Thermoflexus sp. TaxID=1969742 RepID=UPI002ADDF6C4
MSEINMIDKIAERWIAKLNDNEKSRLQRAVEGLKSGALRVTLVNDTAYQVANGERTYMVRYDGDRWACECPDFLNRGFRCKHLFAAFLAQR